MASFAYLEPVLELALGNLAAIPQQNHIDIPVIPCELDNSWKTFENDLHNFKLKFNIAKRDLGVAANKLTTIKNNTDLSKLIADKIDSEDLKAKILSLVDNYESDEGLHTLTQQCGELKGQMYEMEKVLKNTNAERYAKYMCFVCMDRSIDLFFDPCGHVVCDLCWLNTREKRTCPGCRTPLQEAKKIFTI
jgi:hypothetical protein